MRKGRTPLKGDAGCLLLNISIVMERDRITGRPPPSPAPPRGSGLCWCFGKEAPRRHCPHFCGHISFPLHCSEVVGGNILKAKLHQPWL